MVNRPITVVAYATRDGQAQRIAERITERLGRDTSVRCVNCAVLTPPEIAAAALVVVVAAVRYGKHLPEANRLLSDYAGLKKAPPLALASVNLTARKSGKTTAQGNAYLRKLIAGHRLKPVIATAFAGRLDYARYRWSDRHLIRLIMWLTGGPTDLETCIEYTDWHAVDDFAAETGAFWKRSLQDY